MAHLPSDEAFGSTRQVTSYNGLLLERAIPLLVTIVLVVTAAQDVYVLVQGLAEAPTTANVVFTIGVAAVWLTALASPDLRLRWSIQILAMTAVVFAPLITGMTVDVWASTTALAIAIAFAAPLRLSLPLIVAVAGLQGMWAMSPPGSAVLLTGPIGVISLPLVTLLGVGGLALTRQGLWASVGRADAELVIQHDLVVAERYRTRAELARAAVARRIHETALNTIAAISMGPVDPQAVRRAARRDLAAADGNADHDALHSLRDVLEAACKSARTTGLTITLEIHDDAALDDRAARVLRDAIVEALRNVRRHSGGADAHVEGVDQGREVRVRVSDDGAGISATSPERFGISEGMRASMASIGGWCDIDSSPGRGTLVTLTVPTSLDDASLQPKAARRLLDDSALARVGLTGFAIFAGIASPALARGFGSMSVFVLLLGYVAAILALAALWGTRARIPLAIASLGFLVALYGAVVWIGTSGGGLTCAVSSDVTWMGVTAGGGGTLLAVLAYRTIASMALAVTVAITAPALALLVLPAACRDPQFALRNAMYILGALAVVTWIDRSFERQRMTTALAWDARLDEGARAHAAAAEAAAWRRLDGEPRAFLVSLVESPDDALTSETRARASRCASLLRNRLLSRYPEPLQGLLDDLQEEITAPIDVDVFDLDQASDVSLPPNVTQLVVDLLTRGATVAPQSLSVALVNDDGQETLVISVEGQEVDPVLVSENGVDLEAVVVGTMRSLITVTLHRAAVPPAVR